MLTTKIASLQGFEVSDGGKSVTVRSADDEGNVLMLKFETKNMASQIAMLIEARAAAIVAGGADPDALLLKEFSTWQVGGTSLGDCAILVFDRGLPTVAAFRFIPQTARDAGKALIAQARACREAASKVVRN